jgi:hypothetical protein
MEEWILICPIIKKFIYSSDCIYLLTMLCVGQTTECQLIGWSVNKEFGMTEEVTRLILGTILAFAWRDWRKAQKQQSGLFLSGKDMNWAPFKYVTKLYW